MHLVTIVTPITLPGEVATSQRRERSLNGVFVCQTFNCITTEKEVTDDVN